MQVMSKQYIQVYKYIDNKKRANKNLHVLPENNIHLVEVTVNFWMCVQTF